MNSSNPKRIGIIGAGAAGLCAARHFCNSIEGNFKVTLLEQQDHVGGTWKHSTDIDKDTTGNRVHSSMYDNLRTNLPKQIMEYPDFPFVDPEGDSFIHHTVVQKYLEDYAQHFELEKCIKFCRKVDSVKLLHPDKWLVDVTVTLDGSKENYTFDALIVAIGSYTYPRIPLIKGMEKFKGKIVHSHDYRNNKPYKDARVLVLGAGPSGTDIALELVRVANKVILCHANENIFKETSKPECLEENPLIASLENHWAVFPDGSRREIDVLMLCTGYDLKFDHLLTPECHINVNDRRVTPLFKHYISIIHPNLAIFGINFRVIPFPLFHVQALALTKFWNGTINLPSKEEMLADEEADFQKRLKLGMPVRYAHILQGDLQFGFMDALADLAQIPKLAPKYEKLYRYTHALRKSNPINYKDIKIN